MQSNNLCGTNMENINARDPSFNTVRVLCSVFMFSVCVQIELLREENVSEIKWKDTSFNDKNDSLTTDSPSAVELTVECEVAYRILHYIRSKCCICFLFPHLSSVEEQSRAHIRYDMTTFSIHPFAFSVLGLLHFWQILCRIAHSCIQFGYAIWFAFSANSTIIRIRVANHKSNIAAERSK